MLHPFLIGEKVYLRPLLRADVPLFLKWINDPEVREHLAMHRPMTEKNEEEWVASAATDVNNVCLVIALQDGDRPIGTLDLRGVQNKNRCADLGIQIGEKDCWSQGYGREAIGLLLAYGFNTLNLNRIELTVYANNLRAIRCYEQCGFQAEGRKRQAHFGQGRYHDVLLYGILAEDFRKLHPTSNPPA